MMVREEIFDQVSKLVDSELLRSSPSLVRLLVFCVNTALAGEEESLKETTIGISCFGRSPGYDTKLDPIVRVSARRLRRKLELFYQMEGKDAEVQITLPKGKYIPRFHRVELAPPVAEPLVAEDVQAQEAQTFAPESVLFEQPVSVERESVSRAPASEAPLPVLPAPVILKKLANHWFRYRVVLFLTFLVVALSAGTFAVVRSHRVTELPAQGFERYMEMPSAGSATPRQALSLSPDGKKVTFSSGGNRSSIPHVYLQSRDSNRSTPLTGTGFPEMQPVWSEDGKTITLLREVAPAFYQLVMVDVATRSEKVLRSIAFSSSEAKPEPGSASEGYPGDRIAPSNSQGKEEFANSRHPVVGRSPSSRLSKKSLSPEGAAGAARTPGFEDVSYKLPGSFEPRL